MITSKTETATKSNHEGLPVSFAREWFGLHGGREVLMFKPYRDRKFLEVVDQLFAYEEYSRRENVPCFISVHPFSERNKVLGLEKLFFDFDVDNKLLKGECFEEVKNFAKYLEKKKNIKPLIVFSGNKGYHLYVWLWSTLQVDDDYFMKELYTEMQMQLIKGLDLKTLDKNPFGDIARLARVPYSIHQVSGLETQPVDFFHNRIELSEIEVYRKYGLQKDFVKMCFNETKRKIELRKEQMNTSSKYYKGSTQVRPCLKAALEKDLRGRTGHKIRLAIACEYLNHGFSVDEVTQLFSKQLDFGDGRKSHYFIEDTQKKDYKPFKCSSLLALDCCLKEKCSTWRKKFGK